VCDTLRQNICRAEGEASTAGALRKTRRPNQFRTKKKRLLRGTVTPDLCITERRFAFKKSPIQQNNCELQNMSNFRISVRNLSCFNHVLASWELLFPLEPCPTSEPSAPTVRGGSTKAYQPSIGKPKAAVVIRRNSSWSAQHIATIPKKSRKVSRSNPLLPK